LRPPSVATPVASDQVRVSDNNKNTIAETNAVASKNAQTNKIKEKRHALSPKIKQEDGNEVTHAPSADEHRRERDEFDALVAELVEDQKGLHFTFDSLTTMVADMRPLFF